MNPRKGSRKQKARSAVRLGALVFLAMLLSIGVAWFLFAVQRKPPVISVFFTPGDKITNEIVAALGQAKQAVLVQAYLFTSAPIGQALVNATKRGVHVQVILDSNSKTNDKYSSADYLAHNHIRCFLDDAHAIAHNKIMIIDGETVITGSYNFTKAAEERNAENLLIIHDPAVASKYVTNWRLHQAHSPKYEGK
jgi:phosphatidylserine/phosphatidylglycerophosphate/cardiolipin synthase-like enzyme